MLSSSGRAQHDRVLRSTDVLCLLPSATGLAMAWANHDREGMAQWAMSAVASTAVSYALELSIRKDRPDGTGRHAIPSTHAMAAFSGASFLQRRYGWKWGVPAYTLSTYVAWGRVYGRKHDVWDVLAGAAIGVGGTYIFSRPFMRGKEVTVAPTVTDGAKAICFSMTF